MGNQISRWSKQGSRKSSKSKSIAEEKPFSIAKIAPDHVDVDQQPWPCLLISHGTNQKPILTFYNASTEQYQSKLALELVNKTVLKSNGQWLLIQDDINESDYCILNVVTMEKLQLPRLEEDLELNCHGGYFSLSSQNPTASEGDCHAYIMKGADHVNMFWPIGAKEFIRQELVELKREDIRPMTAAVFQGKVYYMTGPELSLYCSEPEIAPSDKVHLREIITEEKMNTLLFNKDRCFLLELCGQLLYIDRVVSDVRQAMFQILRADLEASTWEKVNDIGDDYAIFYDDFGAFAACVAGCGLRGNCVYYPEDDGSLNAYDLGNGGGCFRLLSPLPFTETTSELRWLLISNINSK
ncbi:OLC1v1002653C1 [Oldenlandia corymbosa var. corymbosa]|uniref:OLC1v1002653C1 n=1 Tax=Oldenlandia corymbosa var. corymbosa TaxID=529605 RepID=A0AAV1D9T7_OLDCO|nr:OLC1v1002653C1 [Oldenlandia corymbosa var. corymbosa]